MPHHYSNYRFPVPEARRQASLISIESDLMGVIAYCDYLMQNNDVYKMNFILWEGMSSAALVRYARCFSPGARDQLERSLLEGADEKLRQWHDYFITLRNKHFAHSVNPFEENDVTVQIGDHFTSSEEIVSLGAVHGRNIGLAPDHPEELKKLAEWVWSKVKAMKNQEKEKVLAAARSRSLDELKGYGIPSPGADARRHNVGRTRSRP